jgi:hypothetical protein
MRHMRETGDDLLTRRFGYRPQFDRSLRSFESFARRRGTGRAGGGGGPRPCRLEGVMPRA